MFDVRNDTYFVVTTFHQVLLYGDRMFDVRNDTYFVVTTFHQVLLYGDRMFDVDVLVQLLDWQQFQFLQMPMTGHHQTAWRQTHQQ